MKSVAYIIVGWDLCITKWLKPHGQVAHRAQADKILLRIKDASENFVRQPELAVQSCIDRMEQRRLLV